MEPLSEEQQILKDIKHLEQTRDQVIANAAIRTKIQESTGKKESIQDQVNPLSEQPDRATELADETVSVTQPFSELPDRATQLADETSPVTQPFSELPDRATQLADESVPVTQPFLELPDRATQLADETVPVTQPLSEQRDRASELADETVLVTQPLSEQCDRASELADETVLVTQPLSEQPDRATELGDETFPVTQVIEVADEAVVDEAVVDVVVEVVPDEAVQLQGARRPWFSLLAIPCIGALLTIINKRAIMDGMDVHILCRNRNMIASIALAGIVYRAERNSWRFVTRGIIWRLLLLGLLEPVLNQQFTYSGLAYLPASFSASIGLLQPVVTLVAAYLIRRERIAIRAWPSQAKLLGIVVALVGASLIISEPLKKQASFPWTKNTKKGGNLKENIIRGIIFCLIAMVSGSGYSLLLENTLSVFDFPWSISGCTCLLGAIVNALVVPILGTGREQNILGLSTSLLAYVYSGIFASVLASFLFARVLQAFGTVTVAAFGPLSMVLVTCTSVALGEPILWIRAIGVAVLLVGMCFIVWGKQLETRGVRDRGVRET